MLDVCLCYVFASLKVFLAFFARQRSERRAVVALAVSVAASELVHDLVALVDTRSAPRLSSPLLVAVELK